MLRGKTISEGKLEKYKARVVAKRLRKMDGVDYDETFPPKVGFMSGARGAGSFAG